jgi:hypothetical protein
MQNLDNLSEKLVDNLDDVLDHFNIDYTKFNGRYSMNCEIHNGNNKNALNIFIGNRAYVPNWKCYTNSCQLQWGAGIFGFIRGVLSNKENREISYKDTLSWLCKYFNFELDNYNISDNKLKSSFIHMFGVNEPKEQAIDKKLIHSLPFSTDHPKNIVEKYNIRHVTNEINGMWNRTIYPIYNNESIIGLSGRTHYEKCPKCDLYHSGRCPSDWMQNYVKWKHYKFTSTNYLFNSWLATPFIKKSGCAIAVEGPKDCLALEQAGIHNSVATFGVNLSIKQKELLEKCGVVNLILCFDNDKAGQLATERISKQYKHLFNIATVDIGAFKDFGEMDSDSIRKLFINNKLGIL